MKILYLGADSKLIPFLRSQSEEVDVMTEPLEVKTIQAGNYAFLISYGYRHILRKDLLDLFPGRAINLHVSFLPWNRGADPNFWSFVEDTPKGVTIHYLDEGVDTGDIIIQRRVEMAPDETLATSYERLKIEIESLFQKTWAQIRSGTCPRIPQPAGGSVHRSIDKERLAHLLTKGWQTPVSQLRPGDRTKG